SSVLAPGGGARRHGALGAHAARATVARGTDSWGDRHGLPPPATHTRAGVVCGCAARRATRVGGDMAGPALRDRAIAGGGERAYACRGRAGARAHGFVDGAVCRSAIPGR